MVEHNRCLVHVHIPRTGGTTLRHLLLPRMLELWPPDAIYLIDIGPEYGCRTGSFGDFAALSWRERRSLRFVSGHVPLEIADLLPNPLLFTVMRNPVDRALSDYWYSYHEGSNAAHPKARSLSAIEFVAGGWGQTQNGHARYLAGAAFSGEQIDDDELFARARRRLNNVSYIGLFEQLENVVDDLCALAGLRPVDGLIHLNDAQRLMGTSTHDLDVIAYYNLVDIALHAMALRMRPFKTTFSRSPVDGCRRPSDRRSSGTSFPIPSRA
jgi:hypothetical protein